MPCICHSNDRLSRLVVGILQLRGAVYYIHCRNTRLPRGGHVFFLPLQQRSSQKGVYALFVHCCCLLLFGTSAGGTDKTHDVCQIHKKQSTNIQTKKQTHKQTNTFLSTCQVQQRAEPVRSSAEVHRQKRASPELSEPDRGSPHQNGRRDGPDDGVSKALRAAGAAGAVGVGVAVIVGGGVATVSVGVGC